MSRRNNTGQLLQYILRYIFQENNQTPIKLSSKEVIFHNIRSRTLPKIIAEYKQLEKRRIRTMKSPVVINHIVLSWGIEDSQYLSDDAIKDMANEFIRLRGITNMYCGAIHRDKQAHIHLCMSSLSLNFKSNRISKKKFADIKDKLTLYQKEMYPDLQHSLPLHGAKQKGLQREITKNTGRKPLIKDTLSCDIRQLIEANSKSVKLETLLTSKGYTPYLRGIERRLTGIIYKGKKYRLKTLGIIITPYLAQAKKIEERILKLKSIRNKQRTQLLERGHRG